LSTVRRVLNLAAENGATKRAALAQQAACVRA